MEGGQETDVRNLLQLMNHGSLDETAYNLTTKHPQNGFYDTPAFKRIRSKEMAYTRRIRMNSGPHKTKKTYQRNLNAEKKAGAQHPRGRQQSGGKGRVPYHGQGQKKGKVKQRSDTPIP